MEGHFAAVRCEVVVLRSVQIKRTLGACNIAEASHVVSDIAAQGIRPVLRGEKVRIPPKTAFRGSLR